MTETAANGKQPLNAQIAPTSQTETITLKRAHVHCRIPCQPADTLLVRPDQAKRLKARKIAE